MRWLRFFVLVILLSIFIPSGIILAASPSVDDVKVFQNYEHTGDWLIVAVYNISGTNASTSSCDIYTYPWYIQLINTGTGVAITNNPIEQCGMRPFGISINSSMALGLTYGGNYSVKIYGSWGTTPNTSRIINSSDWRGNNLVYLDQWVIKQAKTIQTFDAKTYVVTVPEYNEVLNVDGGSIFDLGIPYLSTYRPDIFQVTTENYPIGYIPSNGSTSYADDLYNNWDVALGPDVSGALTTVAPYFGFTGVDGGRMVGALLTLMGFLSLAIIEKSVAFMVILGGVMIGVFPMATVILLVFVLAVVLIRSLFWSST